MAVITYDSNKDSRKFSDQYSAGYSILQDIDGKYVKMLDILNESYKPGHRAYGVPHPGIFLLDTSGVIRAKFSEEDYKDRPSLNFVLKAAQKIASLDALLEK